MRLSFWSQLFRLLFFAGLCVSVMFWASRNASGWWWSLLFPICFYWASEMLDLWQKIKIERDLSSFCDRLSSVYMSLMLLRTLAFLGALTAWGISLREGQAFVDNTSVDWVRWSWVVASALWCVSLTPLIICMFQCLIDDKDNVKRRSFFLSWLLHDLVLGVFWVYLAVELYDLPNDSDDSAWRSLFRSMIAWHGVIVLFREIYKGKSIKKCNTKCFSIESRAAWGTCLRLLGLLLIYIIIMIRFQDENVLLMGLNTPSAIVFILGIIFVGSGQYIENIKEEKKTVIKRRSYGNTNFGIQF